MALAYIPLEIDQGEDWTAQIVLTDQDGNAVTLTRPMQMDFKNSQGQLWISLHTISVEEEAASSDIPEISFSPDIGMIQLHIDKGVTAQMPPGPYSYDLFANVNDGAVYAGNQTIRVIAGQAIVNKRVTVM